MAHQKTERGHDQKTFVECDTLHYLNTLSSEIVTKNAERQRERFAPILLNSGSLWDWLLGRYKTTIA